MKKLFLLFALSGMVAVGCSKELLDENNTFNIPAEGGTVVIPHKTTVACEIIIPEEAQTWITITTETSGSVTYNTTLNIAANNSGKQRSCVVKVVSQGHNEVFAEYTITQSTRYCLCYTTNDGKVVKPTVNSPFGATILSNTYKDGIGIIEFDAPITSIGNGTFISSSLTSVTVPDSVTEIGELAFFCCSSLTSITIPDSVTEIGNSVFSGCVSLTSITIGNGLTSIGEGAFGKCSSLTSITVPDSVTEIGEHAFWGCSSLTKFNGKFASEDGRCLIIEGVLNSFAPAGLTEYSIPDSVTEIGEWAFRDCSNLTSVTIPDSVTSIGEWAFYECSSLTSVTIPDSVTSIGICAFEDCSSLTKFNGKFASEDGRCLIIEGVLNSFVPAGLTEYSVPDSVTSIEEYAFRDCNFLTSVTIPDSVKEIRRSAFDGCSSLTSVTIGNGVTSIGNSAFDGCCGLTCVTIPDSVTEIGRYAFDGCSSLTSITIGNGLTSIGEFAFYNCSGLTSVTIPDRVTEIGICAFEDCISLTSVTIPDSVTSIGAGAFYDCSSLTNVYCKPTTPPAGDYDIFTGNASGRKIYVPTESVEAYKNASHWSDYASDIVSYNFQ